MGELRDWADSQTDRLVIEPGEAVLVKYLGFKVIPNRFDPKSTTVEYHLLVGEEEKTFTSRSGTLARGFDKIEIEGTAKILRTGEGSNTRYKIVPVFTREGREIGEEPKEEIEEPEELPEKEIGKAEKAIKEMEVKEKKASGQAGSAEG